MKRHEDRRYYPDREGLLARETPLFARSAGGRLHVALVFPQPYTMAMSNLGFQYIYRALSSISDVECERVFYAPEGRPASFETERPLGDFDVIAFSVSYALDFPAMLELLLRAGVPLHPGERDGRPLVVAGGVAITTNPLPLADFFDVFFIGDGEESLPTAIDALLEAPEREAWLDALAPLPGYFIPDRHDTGGAIEIAPGTVADFSAWPVASGILTPDTEFADRMLIESTRGCPYLCRFCLAKYIHGNLKHRDMEAVWTMADRPEVAQVGLIGAGVSTHPKFVEMCEGLLSRGKGISCSSLRLNNVSQAMADVLVRGGQKTITIAPEAGDETTRWEVLGKTAKDDMILETARRVGKAGAAGLKCYFLTGIPGAPEEETEKLIALVQAIRREYTGANGGHGVVTAGVSPFVPKPQTPWSASPMIPPAAARRNLAAMQKAWSGDPQIRLTSTSPYESLLDGLLSQGERSLGPVLATLAALPASRRKNWILQNLRVLIKKIRESPSSVRFVLSHRVHAHEFEVRHPRRYAQQGPQQPV